MAGSALQGDLPYQPVPVTPSPPSAASRLGLVLGGGGLKGFAHIGALRALAERNVRPQLVAGSSIGALIGTAYASGMSIDDMHERAVNLRRRDLFRINHFGMALERMRSPSIYLESPLRSLVNSICPDVLLSELQTPTIVNTVDVEHGTQVAWGLPGLADVPARDAVYASCSLPGFFPPGIVDGRTCVDGGTMDNLPVSAAAGYGLKAIIAVDVGNSDLARAESVADEGFASIYMRAATVMMRHLQLFPLESWGSPPMLLVRPRVSHIRWFSFGNAEELIQAGYEAMNEALEHLDVCLVAESGIYPRRRVALSVDRATCIGCGLCVALAPDTMALDHERVAYPVEGEVLWSPADGEFVRQCPTLAIRAESDEKPAVSETADSDSVATETRPAAVVRLRRRFGRLKSRITPSASSPVVLEGQREERPRIRPRKERRRG